MRYIDVKKIVCFQKRSFPFSDLCTYFSEYVTVSKHMSAYFILFK